MNKKIQSDCFFKELLQKKILGEKLDFSTVTYDELNLLFYHNPAMRIAELFDTSESKIRYKMRKLGINLRNQIIDDFFDNYDRFAELHAEAKENIKTAENINKISKAITHFAFRNGPVEDMHAHGNLSENDMMILNKFMVNRLAYVFKLIIEDRWAEFEFLIEMTDKWYGHDWDDAVLDDGGTREIFRKMHGKYIK